MSLWFDIARLAVGVNVALLFVLIGIWGRNYLQFRTKHTFGLAMFGTFLLAENALSLYVYLMDPTLSAWFSSEVPAIAWRAMMLLHVLETFGLAVLVWITWD